MSVDYEKYNKRLITIERGIKQLLENATEKTKNAIAMKKEAESMTQEVDEELKKYKSTREVNHELIEKKMEELRNTTAMISEMESKALMDSQKKLDEINAKIEEAKMDSSYALTMSETVTNFRKLLENRPSYKP
jgi:uncharacterized protein involved in exopolysaccharide biosynthesis